MEVNKKILSEIFGVSVRTIQNWQDQGMPVARGGGKGNEVLYNSAAVIEWYSARDTAIENEKLRKEVEDLRIASESDLQPGTIEYERHRLTRAQADAQELKNAKESAEVVETAFCTFVLSRIAEKLPVFSMECLCRFSGASRNWKTDILISSRRTSLRP